MKCLNLVIAIASLMTFSTSAFANSIDLFTALTNAGVSMEVAMSKIYVGVTDLRCVNSDGFVCETIDSGIEAQGKKIVVNGAKAESILDAILESDAGPFDPYGKYEFVVDSITCVTRNTGEIDIVTGETSDCDIRYRAE